MKVKAAILRELNAPFEVTEITLAPIKNDEVRVKIIATGVCHTDAVAQSIAGVIPLPGILGHEGAGIIDEVGDNVTNLTKGDHVVLSFASCHQCDHCLEGHPFVCEEFNLLNFGGKLSDQHTPYTLNDQSLSVFFGQSSFSEYVNVKAENIVKVDADPTVDLALLGPLGCGIQTGAGTVINHLQPKAGESIIIFGTGAVGLSAIMAAKAVGATPIIAIDIHDHRLKLAKELGATHIINSQQIALAPAITEIVGKGASFAVETTGVPIVVKDAVASIKPLGKVAIVGFTGDVTFNIQNDIMAEGKTLVGVIEGDSVPQTFIPKLIKLYKQGLFPFDRLIKFYPLSEINQAFADSASGKVIKPIVRM